MLRHRSSRQPAITRRPSSTVSPAASWDSGPQPLQLELTLEQRRPPTAPSVTEKEAGSCVLVINIAGDDEDTE